MARKRAYIALGWGQSGVSDFFFPARESGYVHHYTAHGEAALGLHTVVPDVLVVDDVAVLGDVPWRAWVAALGVDGVGRGLDVDSVGPDDEQRDVQ